MKYILLFEITIISITLLNAACIFDVFEKATYDIYNATIVNQFREISCNCLSNIIANTSDTSSSCNKLMCALECAAEELGIVSRF